MDSFSEAINPVLKLSRVIGLDFKVEQDGGNRMIVRIFKHIYAIACLLANIGNISYKTSEIVRYSKTATLANLNDFIDMFNLHLNIAGSHLCAYYIAHYSFPKIMNAFEQLHHAMEYDTTYFEKLRRTSWLSAIFVSTFVLTQIVLSIYLSQNLRKIIQLVPGDLGYMYSMTSYILFFVLAWSLAESFKHLDGMVAISLRKRCKIVDGSDLEEIRFIHGVTCQAVDILNDTFKTLSLLHTIFVYTGIVNTCFLMVTNPSFNPKILMYLSETMWRLWLLGYACDRVQNEAVACLKTLASSKNNQVVSHSIMHQQQHIMLGMQVIQTQPKFDIYGMFHLNRQLMPTLFAAMMTYTVILYQFKTS